MILYVIYTYICVCVCLCVCVFKNLCIILVCIYMCAFVYTHTHTHTHTHIHIIYFCTYFNDFNVIKKKWQMMQFDCLWHINSLGLSNAKSILLSCGSTIQQEGYTFPNGICPKVIVILQLKFELAYYGFVVQCCNHNARKIPPHPCTF